MTAIQDFALEAARKYLHSIVFVDDEIYEPFKASPISVNVPGAESMTVFKPAVPVADETDRSSLNATEAAQSEPVESRFDAKDLVESFARERMVCALYEPQANFETDSDSDLFKLCERADVVILDWEFQKEPGSKILPLISGLVSAAQTTVPHHVRLCAIYTTTPDLKKVASQIFDHLEAKGLSVLPDGDYRLNAGSSRIVVLGKPAVGRPADQAKEAQVEEAGLATRIIEEFAAMHSGIMPSMALKGLASVRTNAKKILNKFRAEMDGAFLVHRGLILPKDDAFEQIPELLAEEALAVMVDNQLPPDKAKKLADEVIDSFKIKTNWRTKNDAPQTAGDLATKMLKGGPDKIRKKVDITPDTLRRLHDELDKDSISAKERLAALYSSRTQYGNDRALCFGTIVRHKLEHSEMEYSMCLMPLCDSVRLTSGTPYQFPFWKLRTDNQKNPSKAMVIELPNDEGFVELFSMGKPRDQLWMECFGASASRMVQANAEGSSFLFTAESGKTLEWVAQLKPSHAQRIAHDIGALFSRVGVLEAEWLRLKADRQ